MWLLTRTGALILLGCLACGEPQQQTLPASQVVVDVSHLAGSSEPEVAARLGEPDERTWAWLPTGHHPNLIYQGGRVEIVFVDGRADWITVRDLSDVDFSARAPEVVGIGGLAQPSHSDEHTIRWEGDAAAPFRGVYVFSEDGGRVGMILVTTRTWM